MEARLQVSVAAFLWCVCIIEPLVMYAMIDWLLQLLLIVAFECGCVIVALRWLLDSIGFPFTTNG